MKDFYKGKKFMERFQVILKPAYSKPYHTGKGTIVTTGAIQLIDNKKVQEPTEFKDVAFADLVAKLLNNFYAKQR